MFYTFQSTFILSFNNSMRKSERLQNLPKVMWLLMAKQGEILRIFTFHGVDGHELDSGEWNHGPG